MFGLLFSSVKRKKKKDESLKNDAKKQSEQLLFEQDGVTVWFVRVEQDVAYKKTMAVFKVKNDTDNVIWVQDRGISFNVESMKSFMSDYIMPNSFGFAECTVNRLFEDEIKSICITIHLYWETWVSAVEEDLHYDFCVRIDLEDPSKTKVLAINGNRLATDCTDACEQWIDRAEQNAREVLN